MKNEFKTIKIDVLLEWMQSETSETLEIELPENCTEKQKQKLISENINEWLHNEVSVGWSEIPR